MNKNAELYDFTQNAQGIVWQAAFQEYSHKQKDVSVQLPTLLQIRRGYAESPGWMMVQAAEFDPEPLSVDRFRKRAVYSSPRLSQAILELLASEKWLDRTGEDYYLTDEGRKIIEQGYKRRIEPFMGFTPIPEHDIQRLTMLTRKVLDASMQAETPPGTWCLAHSRRRAPVDDVAPLAHLIQHCSDFNAFRDDAHMAAYGAHHDVDGMVWEAFSQIAEKHAKNADDLYQNLAYRGFYTQDWQEALKNLVERGWIHSTDGVYTITDTGREKRQEVEKRTNQYFYAPWAILSSDEFTELVTLLEQLVKTCTSLIKG